MQKKLQILIIGEDEMIFQRTTISGVLNTLNKIKAKTSGHTLAHKGIKHKLPPPLFFFFFLANHQFKIYLVLSWEVILVRVSCHNIMPCFLFPRNLD